MRKIRIDDDIRAVAAEYRTQLDKYKTKILNAIDNLKSKFDGTHTILSQGKLALTPLEVKAFHDYVDKFKTDYAKDRFVLMLPNAFEDVIKEYSRILSATDLNRKLSFNGEKKCPRFQTGW